MVSLFSEHDPYQEPRAAIEVSAGTTVSLTVSRELIEVPDVFGDHLRGARAPVKAKGFRVQLKYHRDEFGLYGDGTAMDSYPSVGKPGQVVT